MKRWLCVLLLGSLAGPASAQTPEAVEQVEQKLLKLRLQRAAEMLQKSHEHDPKSVELGLRVLSLQLAGENKPEPESDLDRAKTALEKARLDLERAKAQVAQEAARLKKLQDAPAPAKSAAPAKSPENATPPTPAPDSKMYDLYRRVRTPEGTAAPVVVRYWLKGPSAEDGDVLMLWDYSPIAGKDLVRRTHALTKDKADKLLAFLSGFVPAGTAEAEWVGGGLVTTATPEVDRLLAALVAVMNGQKPAKAGVAPGTPAKVGVGDGEWNTTDVKTFKLRAQPLKLQDAIQSSKDEPQRWRVEVVDPTAPPRTGTTGTWKAQSLDENYELPLPPVPARTK